MQMTLTNHATQNNAGTASADSEDRQDAVLTNHSRVPPFDSFLPSGGGGDPETNLGT